MLFTEALENIFLRLTWETRGSKIDGKYLSHFRFADDILIVLLCANTPHQLKQMLQELAEKKWKSGYEDEQVEDKGDDGK